MINAAKEAPAGEEYVFCYLCGADNYEPILRRKGMTVVRCRECGLMYTNPRLDAESLARSYDYDQKDLEWRLKVWKRSRLVAFKRYASEIEPYRETGKLFEIGPGLGWFLQVCAERGWAVTGADLAKIRCEYIRETHGIEVHHGTLEDVFPALEAGTFDVVAAWNVFEHLRDPEGTLRIIEQLLRPGGVTVLKMPDGRALSGMEFPWYLQPLLRLYRRRIYTSTPTHHLVQWTPEHLGQLMSRCGLNLARVDDFVPLEERPIKHLREHLRQALYARLGFPYYFVAFGEKPGAKGTGP